MTSPSNFPYGPGQVQDNVTGLPAGQAKVLGSIGLSQTLIYDFVIAPMQFQVGANAVGTIEIYMASSDTTGQIGDWTDGIDPTSSADQSSKISTAPRAAVINVQQGGATYKTDSFSVYTTYLFIPMFVCLIVYNKTSVAFNSTPTNFICQYSQLNYTGPVPINCGGTGFTLLTSDDISRFLTSDDGTSFLVPT